MQEGFCQTDNRTVPTPRLDKKLKGGGHLTLADKICLRPNPAPFSMRLRIRRKKKMM